MLTDEMLWELSQTDFAVVDRARLLRVFAPTIDASIARLTSEVDRYANLTSEEYGADPSKAFEDLLDVPFLERAHLVQRAIRAEEGMDFERRAREAAERQSKLDRRDKQELDRLRAKAAARRQQNVRKQRGRAAKARKGRRR